MINGQDQHDKGMIAEDKYMNAEDKYMIAEDKSASDEVMNEGYPPQNLVEGILLWIGLKSRMIIFQVESGQGQQPGH
jgi:hypothetical protein